MKPVAFNNNVLRDGHQSLAATRMPTELMLPACPILDSMGFNALETWGGASIDAGLRFLGEFPFDRLDTLKKACPKTKHMMLFRGQNIVAYTHFPDDVVEAFVNCSARHGMDIFRIFDALNDTRNMECAIRAVNKAGKEAQGAICYTKSPVDTIERFVKMGCELAELGCGSIAIKDMAGLIPPHIVYDIVSGLKKNIKVPVVVHTHETAGMGAPSYYAAVEAGADVIDTSIAPFANGTGQPDTARMLAVLEDNPRKPDYDTKKLLQLREIFQDIYNKLGFYTDLKNEVIDTDALIYQVPGGMLSNFRVQLKEQKMEDKFDEVFAEVPYVREKLGWIPLVTPTSQIVGTQAMMNVKFGRWKMFTPQAMDIALGYYGRTPAPVDPEVKKLAQEKSGKEPITARPADLKGPGMEELRKALAAKGIKNDDEHCVIYAMFPQQLEDLYTKPREFYKLKSPKDKIPACPPPAEAAAKGPQKLKISIDGQERSVTVEKL